MGPTIVGPTIVSEPAAELPDVEAGLLPGRYGYPMHAPVAREQLGAQPEGDEAEQRGEHARRARAATAWGGSAGGCAYGIATVVTARQATSARA